MAGDDYTVLYRNHDENDTTSYAIGIALMPDASYCGFEPPTGKRLKEWNTARNGSGTSYNVGDARPSGGILYAIWVVEPTSYIATSDELIAVADAIRTKGGTSAALEWPDDYVDAIDAISGGGDGNLKAFIERTAITLTLPDDLTKIGNGAFYGCTLLELTSLPSGVTSIGDYAFYSCAKLTLTSLPSGVTSIGNYAFNGCSSLALESLPSGITRLPTNSFNGCRDLALTSLPNGITYIGPYAFQSCSNLAITSLPASLSSLGTYAFYSCSSIESIDIPSGISSIPDYSFANCRSLQTMILRRTSVCALSKVTALSSTPMRGYGGLTGTVYVPSALISTYQTATNWKTLYDGGTLTFAAIEGSPYEL